MKKKKSLYKLIKKELADLTIMLNHISKVDNDLFKSIAIKRARAEYFNIYIKPLMLIYQSKNTFKKSNILKNNNISNIYNGLRT